MKKRDGMRERGRDSEGEGVRLMTKKEKMRKTDNDIRGRERERELREFLRRKLSRLPFFLFKSEAANFLKSLSFFIKIEKLRS